MMRIAARLISDRDGSAAVEMALAFPILLVLMFGAFDLGNYFLAAHVVDKAARDAARYAARLPLANYPSCTVPSGGVAEQQTQRVARFGDPSGTGDQRLAGWTSDTMTTVTIACDNSSVYGTGGIYADFPNGAPVITVSATVPYTPLTGFALGGLGLSASADVQAAVIGA
jgi:hypothetical protein